MLSSVMQREQTHLGRILSVLSSYVFREKYGPVFALKVFGQDLTYITSPSVSVCIMLSIVDLSD
jgi:hypothetical protein